jgi:carbonic anhydrase
MVQQFIEGNRMFQRGLFTQEYELMSALVEGQSPPLMYIGCSDSRVVPELLTLSRPGDIFVVRNVANVVPPAGQGSDSVGAAIEYAVSHLKVPHIVVCGHYGCGGIQALAAGPEQLAHEPHIARWLQWASPILERPAAKLKDAQVRHEALVDENVLLQLRNLSSYKAVRDALKEGRIQLHGWVYNLQVGGLLIYDSDSGRFVSPA